MRWHHDGFTLPRLLLRVKVDGFIAKCHLSNVLKQAPELPVWKILQQILLRKSLLIPFHTFLTSEDSLKTPSELFNHYKTSKSPRQNWYDKKGFKQNS